MNFSTLVRGLALAVTLAAGGAQAAGFYFVDNGSKALLQGGAFVAQADDLTALMYNPAGLTQLNSFGFLVDTGFLNHHTSFRRQDPGFDPANPSPLANEVNNQGGLFWLPFFALSYGFDVGGMPLTFALGLWGPPAVGHYQYPVPNYEKDTAGRYVQNPRKYAPNRYALVDSNLVLAYPSLGVGFSPHKMIHLGATVQLVLSSFHFSQVAYAGGSVGLPTPTRQADEDPIYDNMVSVDLVGTPTVTGIFGIMFKPLDTLSFGVSLRPEIPIKTAGKVSFTLGEAAAGTSTVTGDQATFDLTMPLEIKAGASWQPFQGFRVNADFVYQGWQSLKEYRMHPTDIMIATGSGTPTPAPDFASPRNWIPTYSGRLGLAYDLGRWIPLTLHAGGWYETSAALDEYTNIDFLHFNRVVLTGGVSTHLGPVELIVGMAGTPWQEKVVQSSAIPASSTEAAVPGGIVGNGIYGSSGWALTFGFRANFGKFWDNATVARPTWRFAKESPSMMPDAQPADGTPQPAPTDDAAPAPALEPEKAP